MRTTHAEPVSSTELSMELGEGIVWDLQAARLSWVDIVAGRVHFATLAGDEVRPLGVFEVGAPVGAAYPCGKHSRTLPRW